jgi:F-type H+-transporting ATPase subunit b
LASIDLCWINFLIEKFAWKPILDAVNDRRRRNQITFCRKWKEMQNLQADNQRILQEARMERDNMLKDAKLKKNDC